MWPEILSFWLVLWLKTWSFKERRHFLWIQLSRFLLKFDNLMMTIFLKIALEGSMEACIEELSA